MADTRPDFETETFSAFELYVENGLEFGFCMKSWGQPFYGGSVVRVLGWLHWDYESGKNRKPYPDSFPCRAWDQLSGQEKIINSFVCTRGNTADDGLLIIENVQGKGWLGHG